MLQLDMKDAIIPPANKRELCEEMTPAEFKALYVGDYSSVRAEYPHCDPDVLHAPGTCRHCDMYPDRQAARMGLRINFTGGNVAGRSRCPSEGKRSRREIHAWPGNRPQS